MSDISKVLSLIEDEKVKFTSNLPKDLHTRLVLGQTRYMCRYGTLSDGHEKITPAQRYYQAIKEMWYLGQNIKLQKALVLEAQADHMDAERALESATSEQGRLRAEAALLRAKTRIVDIEVGVQDQMRMLDEYNRIRLELKDRVEAQYPEGIEQAEEDNWRAVFEYRMKKEQGTGVREQTNNIPLRPEVKAELGYAHRRLDAVAPLLIADPAKILQLEQKYKEQV